MDIAEPQVIFLILLINTLFVAHYSKFKKKEVKEDLPIKMDWLQMARRLDWENSAGRQRLRSKFEVVRWILGTPD